MTEINKVRIEAGALLSSLKKAKAQKKRSLSKINDLVEEVHAVDPDDKKLTRCTKSVDDYPTGEGDAVTCGLCISRRTYSDKWEAFWETHPVERGWHMWVPRLLRANKDGRRMVKTKRKREYTVSDKDGVIGVAASYEAGCALKREELRPAAEELTKTVQATPALDPEPETDDEREARR